VQWWLNGSSPSDIQSNQEWRNFGKNGAKALVMFTAFFDASGHEDDTGSLVVAGFIAPVHQWHKFDKEWRRVLDGYDVKALHMKNFAHSRGEFTSWKGEGEKRKSFLASLIAVIRSRACFSFASGVDVKALKDFQERSRGDEVYSRFSSPYALGGISCIVQACEWAIDQRLPPRDLRFIFEDGDKGKGHLIDLSSKILHIDPCFEPKDCHMAFQVADLLAYEVFLTQGKISRIADGEKIHIDSLRKPFQALRSMPGSNAWGFKDRQTFEHLIQKAADRKLSEVASL
jgi:hypothetical protein